MAGEFKKLEDLPELTLAATILLYGEKTPYTSLDDAGKIPLSLLDARYLQTAGGTMAGVLDMANQNIGDVGHITFDLAHADSPGIGELQWNNAEGVLEVGLLGGTVVLQIGGENHAYVVQKTGSTIANGKCVTVIGSSGEKIEVALTDVASGPPLDIPGGITTETILNNQQGYVTTFGLARNINTAAWGEGMFLWADGVTPGNLTNIRPVAPLRAAFIGTVIRSHITDGSIFVFPIIVQNLSLLSDVFAPVLNDGDYLRWNAANSRWQASAT